MDIINDKVIAAQTPLAAQDVITEITDAAKQEQASTAAAQFLAAGMKPGWQSTEFWLTILANVATIAGAFSGLIPMPYGAIAAAAAPVISSIVYSASRGKVKAAQLPALADLAKAIQDAKGFKK